MRSALSPDQRTGSFALEPIAQRLEKLLDLAERCADKARVCPAGLSSHAHRHAQGSKRVRQHSIQNQTRAPADKGRSPSASVHSIQIRATHARKLFERPVDAGRCVLKCAKAENLVSHSTSGNRNCELVLRNVYSNIIRRLFLCHVFLHRRTTALAVIRPRYKLNRHASAAEKDMRSYFVAQSCGGPCRARRQPCIRQPRIHTFQDLPRQQQLDSINSIRHFRADTFTSCVD